MRKVCYIVSDVNKALAFEWVAEYLPKHFQLFFILIGSDGSTLSACLSRLNVRFYEIPDRNNSSLFQRWLKIIHVLRKEKPDVVHTHLWRANLLGLTAAWVARVKKRIFTRHHAVIHYTEFPSGRKWDLLFNYLATDIVAISQNVYQILKDWDKADPHKIRLIHHGFDMAYFRNVQQEQVMSLRSKYNIKSTGPVIGVISRYLEWKGIHYTIEAFQVIKKEFPSAHLILANATGNYTTEIRQWLAPLPGDSYTEIPFEDDVAALYQLFNVFVHVPIGPRVEAFGQTYVEALAAGIPSVFTFSGIAKEFITNEQNALVVEYKNSKEIAIAISRILRQQDIRANLIRNGLSSVGAFELDNMLNRLVKLYE